MTPEDKQVAHKLVDQATLPMLETLVTEWHCDRNLIEGATDKEQTLKLIQEVGELSDSVCKGKPVIDDIGDCLVVLINIAKRNNLTLKECLAHAYKEIMFRKGRMVDGVFVKEDDEKSESDGWIKWEGGERPLPKTQAVEVEFRCGKRNDMCIAGTWAWGWNREGRHSHDIVAYRIIP